MNIKYLPCIISDFRQNEICLCIKHSLIGWDWWWLIIFFANEDTHYQLRKSGKPLLSILLLHSMIEVWNVDKVFSSWHPISIWRQFWTFLSCIPWRIWNPVTSDAPNQIELLGGIHADCALIAHANYSKIQVHHWQPNIPLSIVREDGGGGKLWLILVLLRLFMPFDNNIAKILLN